MAFSPLAIVALVVMLVSPRGARPAGAFAAAWMLSLTVVSTAVLLMADGADASANGAPATWVKIAVGLLLVFFGVRRWRGHNDREPEAATPRWISHLGNVTVARAAGLAAAFNVVKPKNLLLTVGAGLSVAQVGATAAGQAAAICVFVLLGSTGLTLPLAIHVVMGSRGRDLLIELRDWMVRENAAIIAVLSILIAAKLFGDALSSLTS